MFLYRYIARFVILLMCVILISESCIGLQAVVELRGKGAWPLKDPVASVTSALRGTREPGKGPHEITHQSAIETYCKH